MFNTATNVIKKRPIILVFIMILASITVFIEFNNPLISLLSGLKASSEGYFLDALISFLKLIFNPTILAQTIIWGVAAIIVLSVSIGVFFSGYFYIFIRALKNKNKINGEYFIGIKKLFIKISATTALLLLLYSVFLIYLSVCSVPAIVITRAWLTSGTNYAILSIIIDTLTGLILFLSLMFFRSFTIFWLPAIASGERKFMYATKKISKEHFWSISEALLAFDITFSIFNVLFIFVRIKNPDTLLYYCVAWIFYMVFYMLIVTYIFSTYISLSEVNTQPTSSNKYF